MSAKVLILLAVSALLMVNSPLMLRAAETLTLSTEMRTRRSPGLRPREFRRQPRRIAP